MSKSKSTNYIDYNKEWNYPLQWIQESYLARFNYQSLIYRVAQMRHGLPFKNTYQDDIMSNLKEMDKETQESLNAECLKVPDGHSFVLNDSIETISNQLASGVDSYEYVIDDPFMVVNSDLEARLSAQCSMDYVNNGLDQFSGTFAEDLVTYGMSAAICKYDAKHDKNVLLRLHPKNTWVDTMYSTTGKERYRGYSTMIPWHQLKKMVEDDGDEVNLDIKANKNSIFDDKGDLKKAKYSKGKIRTLNDLDIYVQDLNKLAASPDLKGLPTLYGEYAHDLLQCYNVGFYRSYATDPKSQTDNGYHGMDVELTVMYDMNRQIEFKIINRRYVISMNKHAFRRNLIYEQLNPLTNKITSRFREVTLGCPLIFQFLKPTTMTDAPYPVSPVFDLLDTHDELCGWISRRNHVSKILSILRVETNGADASSMKELFNVMGIVIDDVQGHINSVNFNYDYTPIDSQIERLTNKIKEHLKSYSQYDALQVMGDRASAAEAGAAVGAIAQGLVNVQNSLMHYYASIARQFLMNRVLYSANEIFTIVNNGDYSNITIQDMALHAIIRVKPAMAKNVHERQLAANSMAILGNMASEFTPTLKAILIEQALFGQVPRRIVEQNLVNAPISSDAARAARLQAENQALALQQNQALYEQNPTAYEAQNIVDNFTPEEVNEIIAGVSTPQGSVEEAKLTEAPRTLDMENQEGALAVAGLSNFDMGGELANPSSMI